MSADVSTPPPAPQGPGQQGQPAPRKKGVPKWLISIIALVVIGGGVYAYNYFTNDVAQAKAGDCAKITGEKNSPNYEAIGCDSGSATHVVGKVLANTSDSCSEPYASFTMTARRGPDAKLCLLPKWNEGECYKEDTSASEFAKIDCATPTDETLKVVKIVQGKADPAACEGEAIVPLSFPEPPITMCLTPAKQQ
jgi:hypothetical protein